jgi:hypothetical protein
VVKRWLKKHSKWVITGLGVLFIANSSYGLFLAFNSHGEVETWKVILHGFVILTWIPITSIVSGTLDKIIGWWEKD